jgi:nucleoid-associated protein YgaU
MPEEWEQEPQTYTVQPGDTLSKISRKFYGDASRYMEIFYANRDKLDDPNKLQVGWELTIPQIKQES